MDSRKSKTQEEQPKQVRYGLNYRTYRQLQRDYIRFEQEYVTSFLGVFIVRIIVNYMFYVQETTQDEFEKEVLLYISEKHSRKHYHSGRISTNKTLFDAITGFDFASTDEFKIPLLIEYILKKYAELPPYHRERIYYYPQYQIISEAMEKKLLLTIKLLSGNEYVVKPFDIAVDDNSLSYYLIGYSRKESDETFALHSVKLTRIVECKLRKKAFKLSEKELEDIEAQRDIFGSAYMVSGLPKEAIANTVVRLTEKGYKSLFLQIIVHQRPIPVEWPKEVILNGAKYYVLKFNCSHNQIKNYFFSFGKDAEILAPELLRTEFLKRYSEAVDSYLRETLI